MENIEKTIDSTYVYRGKVIDVKKDNIITANGRKSVREIIEHSGGVVIMPITNDNKIITVKQYRYAIQDFSTELPAGKLEKDEDILKAAQRELEEETGYIAKKWINLGYIYTTVGICNEKLHLYLAKDLTYTQTEFDEDEVIEINEYSIEEFSDMINNGIINDSKTICAMYRARKYMQ